MINYLKIMLSIAADDHRNGIQWSRIFRKSYARYKKHGLTGMSKRLIDEANKRHFLNAPQDLIQYKYICPEKPTGTQCNETILFSIIMPVYNVDPKWLEKAIESITSQWYNAWELCIVDDASKRKETKLFLTLIDHPNIKVRFLEENLNISLASNIALKMSNGDYIVLMDHDDELTLDALYQVAETIQKTGAEFIYSDEDKIEMTGIYSDPHFKPDFAPDMFLSQNYLNHLCVIKRDLVEKVGGFRQGYEGSQDYDLYLRVLELTNKIVHIPRVLYHWRKIPGSTAAEFSEKSYAQEAGKKALEDTMKRRSIKASVKDGLVAGTYRVQYALEHTPLISIIIPFKDKPELLAMCIDTIMSKSTYNHFEIIGISNNSIEKETFALMKRLKSYDPRIHFYEYNHPFNYSKINNYAVTNFCRGQHIVLMNNDIEIITEGWIESLLEFSQRSDVGAVGAKLYYPTDTIQHAGVILGIGGVAGHSHKDFPRTANGYFSRLQLIQNLSAVTGACLMVKRSAYDNVGGLDEQNLSIAFNDVDFCLKLLEKGYLNVFTPFCEAYHHESLSRGVEDTSDKQLRFAQEVKFMIGKWSNRLKYDEYYNVNLTMKYEDFSIK